MATWCYTSKDGDTVERFFGQGVHVPATLRCAGKRYFKDIAATHRGLHSRDRGQAAWPMKMDAMAGLPRQAAQLTKDASEKGVPTEFRVEHGKAIPIMRDKAHKRRYLQAYGLHDKHAGYGERAPP
jgi:hypothetical protein